MQLYTDLADWEKVVSCHSRLSAFNAKFSKYEESLKQAEKALSIYDQNELENIEIKIKVYKNLGNALLYKADYLESLNYLNKVVQMEKEIFGSDSPEVAKSILKVGQVYNLNGDYVKAFDYAKQAMFIFNVSPEDNLLSIAECLKKIGIYHGYIGNYSLSLEYIQKSHDKYYSLLGEKSIPVAQSYHHIARLYKKMGEYEKAFTYYEKSLAIILSLRGENNVNVMLINRNLGDLLDLMGKSDESFSSYQKSLSISNLVFGKKHPATASVYINLANSLLKQDVQKSLEYCQLAMVANSYTFSDTKIGSFPNCRDIIDYNEAMRMVRITGASHLNEFEATDDIKDLELSLRNYLLADSLVTTIRENNRSEASRLELNEWAMDIYENAIKTCFLIYKRTGDIQYANHAYYFLERNKASVLKETIFSLEAESIALIPKSLQSLEKEVKKDQSFYLTKIMHEKLNPQKDSTKIIDYESKISSLNTKMDSISQHIRKNFPEYFKLKFDNRIATVDKIRNLMSSGELLIDYFDGEEAVYSFAFSESHFSMYRSIKDSVFIEAEKIFYNSFNWQGEQVISFDEFTISGHKLYSFLVEDVLSDFDLGNSIDRIHIVPNGQLFYIPFDLLLTTHEPSSTPNYIDLNYLFKDYIISYGYSSTLSFTNDERVSKSETYLAFAPVYQGRVLDTTRSVNQERFRGAITPLKWSKYEVEQISTIIDGDYYLASEATEARFKTEAKNTVDIIHMAMHTLIDDDDPMNSKFVFTQDNDSTEDGFLHAFELYNMELNANLAVLSACNTGIGKLARGEGAMSLSRAFRYAGVPNLIMSLWPVSDKATSDLMINFYENIEKGIPYAEALRNAKLHYLEESDLVTSHPLHWGAFVFVGEFTARRFNSNYMYWFLSLLALLMGSVIIWRVKKNS